MRHVWAKNIKTHNNECVKCGVRFEWDGARLSCPGFMPGLKEITDMYGRSVANRLYKPQKHRHNEG